MTLWWNVYFLLTFNEAEFIVNTVWTKKCYYLSFICEKNSS